MQILFDTLKKCHPQLFAYASEDSINILLKDIDRQISKPLALEEFYFQATKLTSVVGCSHTGVRLPAEYQSLISVHGRYFPLQLFFHKNKAYYLSAISEGEYQLIPGDELVSINNKPIAEIIKQLAFYIPVEGCNTTTLYNELNKRFNALFYLVDNSDEFTVSFKSGDGIKTTTLASVGLQELEANVKEGSNNTNIEFLYLENKSIGWLRVASFVINDMGQYLSKLDSVFGDLNSNELQCLIVDLRDNSGGHPIFAAQLYSYLTSKDFVYFKRNDAIKEFEPLYNKMQANKLNFKGKIYVLVNGGCLSTTGHLISLLKFNANAIFVGEEPGSSFTCNDFSMQVTLPKTGVVLNVPRTTFETAVTGFEKCKPFAIDYEVEYEVFDLLNGNDEYLKVVRTLSVQ